MALIDLRQVKGGLKLQQDLLNAQSAITTLQTSYDAVKVLTDITKSGTDKYNVNELLTVLNTFMDDVKGNGGGDTPSLQTIQAAIDTINNRAMKDYVKLTGSSTSGTVTFDTKGLNLDKVQVPVFNAADNTQVLDANGKQVEFDLNTNSFVTAPTKDVNFVVFPTANYTFATAPTDYLLDDAEYAALVNSNSIKALAGELAQDETLISAIQAKVTDQAIKDVLQTSLNSLDTRIAVFEGDATKSGSVANQVQVAKDAVESDLNTAKTALQAAIDKALADAEKYADSILAPVQAEADANKAAIATLNGDASTDGSVAKKIADAIATVQAQLSTTNTKVDTLSTKVDTMSTKLNAIPGEVVDSVTVTNGQTDLAISAVPSADKVKIVINSLIYIEGSAFTVDRTNKKITWSFTAAAGGFDLSSDFEVFVIYNSVA